MAIKDAIEKIVSYFDADEVTDHEDVAKERPVKVQKTEQTPSQQQRKPERPQETVPPRRQHIKSDVQETQVLRSLSLSRSQVNQGSQQMNTTKTTIAIEDAQEIVELLIENECVLIDFQYMLEAQARRCLDFIDGASKVLTGNLQKVGSSMYLLTPINVVVDIEEIGLSHGNQESTFDFDMKRR